MKNIKIFLILAFLLVGCGISTTSTHTTPNIYTPTITSISTATLSTTKLPINTVELPKTPTISPTFTITPENTLEPEKAKEIIKTLLSKPIDCPAPCFWHIIPEQTTVDEAENIFNHLDLKMSKGLYSGRDFASIDYTLDDGLSLDVIITVQNNIVSNMRIEIYPEEQKIGIPRDWLAYSPETLIKRYGVPSRVDFLANWDPRPFFGMYMYFDAEELIVQYEGYYLLIGDQKSSLLFCPLFTQFDDVWLWMGKNPYYPPPKGVLLEEATSLNLEDFSNIMTGDPDKACFQINGEMFP